MRIVVMSFIVAALVVLSAPNEARSASRVWLPSPSSNHSISCKAMQFGNASWYGEELQGSPTADGEIYDMNSFTAAHPTLPFGTMLRVTNLRNQRSLVLRVNDRGPFSRRRIVDVSWAAAKRLGFLEAGVASVRAEVLGISDDRSSKIR